MAKRNEAAAILAYFQQADPAAAKLLFDLIKGVMKQRFKGDRASAAPRKSRRPGLPVVPQSAQSA